MGSKAANTKVVSHIQRIGSQPEMPERDGKKQVEYRPKQASSCRFTRYSRLATSGVNLYHPRIFFKALHRRLKSQRDGTGGKLTVDPPFSFRRERGTGKIKGWKFLAGRDETVFF